MQFESFKVRNLDVAIVGAGFSGIGMAIRLRQAGHEAFALLERSQRIGGTWRDNVYPAAGCDIPSSLYSFASAPAAGWSRRYAKQPEILAYLEECIERFSLRSQLITGCMVVGAAFDAKAAAWTLQLADGSELRSRFVVFARGALSRTVMPRWPGLEHFAGPAFHTARWDRDCVLDGKRVAVIGTGASAAQLVPAIAARVAQLKVFQRTPAWVLPKADVPMKGPLAAAMRTEAGSRLLRLAEHARHEARGLAFWRTSPLTGLLEMRARAHLRAQIPDKALRQKLTPDYRIGCKRVVLSSDFYPSLLRPNVELVTEQVTQVEPQALVTADGHRHAVDVIIFATGFQAAEGPAAPVYGMSGIALGDAWRDGAQAYLGTTLAGFPNLFLLVGPNSGLGHHSITEVIEAQADYVLQALEQTPAGTALSLKPEIQQRHQHWLQSRLQHSVWGSGCDSWYRTKAGRNTVIWPGFVFELKRRLRHFDAQDYERISGAG